MRAALLVFAIVACPLNATDTRADAMAAKFEVAKQEFDRDREEWTATVNEHLENQIEVARSRGTEGLAEAETEARRFRDGDWIPLSLPSELQKRRVTMTKAVVTTGEKAVTVLRAAGNDDAADRITAAVREATAPLAKAEVRRQLVGTWKMTANKFASNFHFRPDGTVFVELKGTTKDWSVDLEQDLIILTPRELGATDRLNLPIRGNVIYGKNSYNVQLKLTRVRN